MKSVYVMTATKMFPEHRALSFDISEILANRKYNVLVKDINSVEEMSAFYKELIPSKCQMIINIDMTGYRAKTIAGIPLLNLVEMNVINYITKPYEMLTFGEENTHFSYMASFLVTSKSEYEKLRGNPNLWNVHYCKDLFELSVYMESLHWKF